MTPKTQKPVAQERKIKFDPAALRKTFGSEDRQFAEGILNQLINVASRGQDVDEKGFAFVQSVVVGIEPRDQLETMLAAQMAAVHNATMTFARRLTHVDNLPQQDSAARAFNQLARTFTAQVEALKRYRSSGQQVVVKHVTVKDGGQAVVGNIECGKQK